LTVEKLAVDCLDVRELQRAAIFKDHWVALSMVSLRWPGIEKMRAYRYLIQLKFRNQVVPQQIRVSWTRCHYGSARPWLHCTFCEQRVARLFKGMGAYYCRHCIGNPLYKASAGARRRGPICRLTDCGKGSAVRIRYSIRCQNGRTA
jgi:hypothetical protein